jgi:2-methylcitrate dehydratase PrpD
MSSTTTRPAVTAALAEYAVTEDLHELADDVLELVRRSLVDTVAVTIAARQDPAVTILRQTMGLDMPSGPATVLFDGTRTSAATAALLNGTAGHALDYDDVTDVIYGHPSVVLWPAVLSCAEQVGASGRDLLEAFVVGFQVQVAVAAGMPVREHYRRGWHSTATIGGLGATAAAARLLGLDAEQTRAALGIAASMAGGSRQNFGTMTKPLHPGLAARDAVMAARLAGNGFTADVEQLESPLGFFAMYGSPDAELGPVVSTVRGPLALQVHGLNVKKYPCCYNTHRTADATLDLAAQAGLRAEDVRRVRVTLEPGAFDPLIHHRPRTGLEGKFSAEYVIAAALLDGEVGLRTFTDEAVQRPEAQRLLRLVEVAESAQPPSGSSEYEFAYSVVQVETDAGEHTFRTDVPRGDRRAPMTREDLEAKFRDCVSFSGTGWDVAGLLEELWSIDDRKPFTGFTAVSG